MRKFIAAGILVGPIAGLILLAASSLHGCSGQCDAGCPYIVFMDKRVCSIADATVFGTASPPVAA